MTPVIGVTCIAPAANKSSPDEKNLPILTAVRSKVRQQQTARCYTSEYWTKLNESIQTTTITGNIRWMYDGIEKALGPVQNKTPK